MKHYSAHEQDRHDRAWPNDEAFLDDDNWPGEAGDAEPQRPTPHFFWNTPPGNEDMPDAGNHDGGQDTQERASNKPKWAARQAMRDKSVFEPPAWARRAGGTGSTLGSTLDKRRTIAIASALTVACGVGLGVALLQWPAVDNVLQGSSAALPALANVAEPVAAPLPAPQKIKPVTGRIAPSGGANGTTSAAGATGAANTTGATSATGAAGTANAATPAPQPAIANLVVVGKTSAPRAVVKPAVQSALAQNLRLRAGERLILGDIIGARALFQKAAELGDANAAFRLGQTYDPAVLAQLGVVGPKPNRELALHWYTQARKAGQPPNALRLGQVQQTGSGQ